jgi:hypothetical protein
MSYIQIKPGVSGQYPTVTVKAFDANVALVTGTLTLTALKDVTVNTSNDSFTWTQLDNTGKLTVPTTANNSIGCNLVVAEADMFGTTVGSPAAGSAPALGLVGLSNAKTMVQVAVTVGTKTLTGNAYVTGLALTGSADSPIWTTPATFTISGSYTIS